MGGRSFAQLRHSGVAFFAMVGATRRERAARRQVQELRNHPGNRNEFPSFKTRRGAEQSGGIRVARAGEDFKRWPDLDHPSGVHDRDTMSDLRHHSQIMGDEQQSEIEFFAEPGEQLDDLLLNGDIERGRRFVGDQHARPHGKRHGNHGALSQASRELMRKLPGANLRLRHGGKFERFDNPTANLGAAKRRLVHANGFLNLRADAHHRIQRGHRLLENHGDFAAAQLAHSLPSHGREIDTPGDTVLRDSEPCPAASPRAVRLKAHEPEREHGLAAARFADKSERLALFDSKRHLVDRPDPAVLGRELHGEIFEFEERSHKNILRPRNGKSRQYPRYNFPMTQAACPKCGAVTIPAMGRSYCPSCSWNRDRAERRFVRIRWLVPALIVIFDLMGIIGLGVGDHNWAGAILLSTLPVLLLGVVFLGATQGLRQLRGPGTARSPVQNADAANRAIESPAEKESLLLSVPPPRQVHLSPRGKTTLTVLLLIVLAFEAVLLANLWGVWSRAHSFAGFGGQEIFLACLALGIAAVPLFMRGRMIGEYELLAKGAVAVGQVTGQRRFRNHAVIAYQFRDTLGQTRSGSANDFTRRLEKDMAVFVFYDPQDSKRHLAACASFFEIVNRSGE